VRTVDAKSLLHACWKRPDAADAATRLEIARLLLAHRGALDLDTPLGLYPGTLLGGVCRHGNRPAAELLLTAGAAGVADAYGETPLRVAAAHGHSRSTTAPTRTANATSRTRRSRSPSPRATWSACGS